MSQKTPFSGPSRSRFNSHQGGCTRYDPEEQENTYRGGLGELQQELEDELRTYDDIVNPLAHYQSRRKGSHDRCAGRRHMEEDVEQSTNEAWFDASGCDQSDFTESEGQFDPCSLPPTPPVRCIPPRNPVFEEGRRTAPSALRGGGIPPYTPQKPPKASYPEQDQAAVPSPETGHAHHGHHSPRGNTEGARTRRDGGRVPQGETEMTDHEHHHHHHHHEGPSEVQRDEKAMSAIRHLTQLRKTPSYINCELERGLEFLNECEPNAEDATPSRSRIRQLPRAPCLAQDDIESLVRCEKQDVDSALYLISDDRKSYKKPCPKQQKAQMNVKALVQAHTAQSCGKDYSPLEHPDPDDITPEVAAAMVFCQERGIELVGCPAKAINYLFPEEKKPPFPEKLPPENASTDQEQKQEEIIEKSASVPSDGLSDSAYSRTMKGKGEELGPQRSYDVEFAVGQTKREYLLVPQKPQRISMAQFRGGGTPSWFPGYLSAFPEQDGGLKLVTSPSKLFHKAWSHSKPANIPASDVIVLD